MPHRLDRGLGIVDAIHAKVSLKVGLTGSIIKGLFRYTPILSPAAVAANTTAEQASP